LTISVFDEANYLPDTWLYAGSSRTFTYECLEEDGVTQLNITNGSAKLLLCPWGEPEITSLEKTGVINTSHSFTISFEAADTINLNGKYQQQPVVTDSSGNIFRPGQGPILVFPSIAES
jgi:hypothetical protein